MTREEAMKRIGELGTSKTKTRFPEVDVSGIPYERPVTTIGISDRYFVAAPGGQFNPDVLAELKVMIQGETSELPSVSGTGDVALSVRKSGKNPEGDSTP